VSPHQNTRLSERLPILGHLGGEITVVEPFTVIALGPRGATIDTRFPLVIDSLHQLRLRLEETAVVVHGRVVHSHINEIATEGVSYRSGLEFVDAPEHVTQALTAYVAALKAARGDDFA
jgi:hypothetical protein